MTTTDPDEDGLDEVLEEDEPSAAPTPTTKLRPTHIEGLQDKIVIGVGALMALSLVVFLVIALARPQLSDLLQSTSQLLFGGLIGLGGTMVGFAFAERKGERKRK